MTGDQAIVASAVLTVLVGILGLVRSIYRAQKADAAKEVRDKAELVGKAFSDGAASRNDEVSLLQSQRDDARRQRDESRIETRDARLDARSWETRYYELLNKPGGH